MKPFTLVSFVAATTVAFNSKVSSFTRDATQNQTGLDLEMEEIQKHLEFFNANGVRSVGSPGYEAAVQHVTSALESSGYNVTIQAFQSPIPDDETVKEERRFVAKEDVFWPVAAKTVGSVETYNVIAELGSGDQVIMAGAHLDTVPASPGVNDNGSGVAALLEIARAIAARHRQIEYPNTVRFAFWGAEEVKLVGSTHYFNETLHPSEREKISMYLNFDMIGSPNYARFVFEPQGNGPPLVEHRIKQVFLDYFKGQGLYAETRAMGCVSDHCSCFPFGIPTGGLYSGGSFANKTLVQAFAYGGTANEPFDACFHRPCDDISNVNITVLEQMAYAAAHTIMTFADALDLANPSSDGSRSNNFQSRGYFVLLLLSLFYLLTL